MNPEEKVVALYGMKLRLETADAQNALAWATANPGQSGHHHPIPSLGSPRSVTAPATEPAACPRSVQATKQTAVVITATYSVQFNNYDDKCSYKTTKYQDLDASLEPAARRSAPDEPRRRAGRRRRIGNSAPPPPLARELYNGAALHPLTTGGASRRARGARDGRPLRRRGPPREARCLRQGRNDGAGTRSRSRDRAASKRAWQRGAAREARRANLHRVRTDLWTGQNRCAWGWSAAAQMLPAPRYSHPICSFWQHHTWHLLVGRPSSSPVGVPRLAVEGLRRRLRTAHSLVGAAPPAFLSSDHPAFQLPNPAAQSYGSDVEAAGPGTNTFGGRTTSCNPSACSRNTTLSSVRTSPPPNSSSPRRSHTVPKPAGVGVEAAEAAPRAPEVAGEAPPAYGVAGAAAAVGAAGAAVGAAAGAAAASWGSPSQLASSMITFFGTSHDCGSPSAQSTFF
ncbi:unnamed protein product [Prorocentrum cordatum]|uniref:Subtilisin n=1 Tax=Prorocentrum cordatum TaxID=2364126 RepID=A0ABN9U8K5_9DINO|nr:unnamed protein product [Polarella glacialis]